MKHFKGITVPVRCQYEKILRIMKITALLLFAAIIQSSANGFSQSTFTINKSVASVKKVIKEIENQSEYSVFYRQDQLDVNKKISIAVKNVSIDSLMKEVLTGQSLTFKVIGKVIVIKPSNENADAVNEITVSGTVYSATGNKPIPGITVSEKNTTNVTITDANGRYTIRVKSSSSVLVFHAVNFKQAEVAVGDQKVINVTLEEEVKILDQVVVVGYGSQKKKDLTGAVAVIGSKELEDRPNTQFGYSIEGKAAGVQVVRSSGQPQAGFSIKVRGTSSITSGSDPLYVVDGVPTYSTNEINPADIETITVLKDASSAAIYGSSGANGVVLITTKHGKNQKTKMNFNVSNMSSQAWKKLPVLNSTQYQALMTEMGISINWANYTANTNWQDLVFRNAQTQNYNLSASGGNENTQYYMSGSLINQEGIVTNNSVKRATFKLNLDHKVNDFLKLGTSISYDRWSDVDVLENDRNGVIARLLTAVPIIGVWDPNYPNQYATSPVAPVDIENPVSVVNQPQHLYTNNRFHGNAYAELSLLPGLKFRSLLGVEHSNSIYTSFQNSIATIYGRSMDGLASENDNNYDYWVSENTLNYNKKIKDHSFALLAGFVASKESNRGVYLSSHGFGGSTAITTVTAGSVQGVPQVSIYTKSHASFIGRLNYSYMDKYLLTSNFRADGSGQFAQQNRWGYFPSFSAGWRISNEDFFKSVKVINDLKLRAGWGIVGNDKANPYAWYGLLSPAAYVIGGNQVNAYVPTTQENANLKWEKTGQFNIGVDITLLKSRLTITADYYKKKTTDLLLYVPIPASVGTQNNIALQNAGSIENKGFEFQISSKNIVKNDFTWNTDFNIYFNKGNVLDIVGTTMYTGGINPAGSTYDVALVKAGLPLGSFYGKYSQGVDPATGNIKYLQAAAGGDSMGVIGNANPKFAYGFTNSFTYKNFSLDIFLQGVSGNQIFNGTKILSEAMSIGENQSATVLNRWQKAGDVTSMPKSTLHDESNVYPSTRFIENGSYLRVKSVTLGYNLPQTLLNRVKITKCMIYVTAENLLTFTKYSGFDPEVSMFNSTSQDNTSKNTAPGVDFGTYPQSRDFIVGLNITF
ncbi:TonB-dependent receptor SusC precursor [mine drainage metagenome]|uniref:TonB-dependent receptor SusC n=1 Tax=mine drainage metagenome TaxID=410659 RepID=A0A1J5TMC2_9ZZZZ